MLQKKNSLNHGAKIKGIKDAIRNVIRNIQYLSNILLIIIIMTKLMHAAH